MVENLVSSDGIPEQFFFPSSSISLKIIWLDSLSFSTSSTNGELDGLFACLLSPLCCSFLRRQLASSTLKRHSADHSQKATDHSQAAFSPDCSCQIKWLLQLALQETVLRRGLKACWLFDSYQNSLCLLGKSEVKAGRKTWKGKMAVDCSA